MKKVLIQVAVLGLLVSGTVFAQGEPVRVQVYVHPPVVPVLTPAARDLPTPGAESQFKQEAKRRDDHGIIVPDIDMPPHGNPLAELQSLARRPGPTPSAFDTPIQNFAGYTSSS